VRGVFVLDPVAGEEGHLSPLDRPHGDRCGGLSVWSVDVDLPDVLQERIEAGPAEDPDPDGLSARPAQADFSLVLEAAGLSGLSGFDEVSDLAGEVDPSPEESEESPPAFDATSAFDRESVE